MIQRVNPQADFVAIEHRVLDFWEKNNIFQKRRDANSGKTKWSFIDGPITANNPMGVHHAWGRTLKDIYNRYKAMSGFELRYQQGFDCQGLWVEIEVEKELGFKSKKDVEEFGIEKFVNMCKERVHKYSKIQTEQSKRLGYWMDWDNSYFTMSDDNNYTIWAFLKKLFNENKIYRGSDVVPWSGRSGTSYSQMEIIEGRQLVSHKAVFVRFPIRERKNEYLLIWTTTPWTLTSNVIVGINGDLDYIKLKASDDSIYYFAKENLQFKRLDKQFKEKKQWIDGVPKLKTIAQIFKERGGYEILDTIKGEEMVGWSYDGPYDHLDAQSESGGYPFENNELAMINACGKSQHQVINPGKDNMGNDIVIAGEGTGIVHMAPGCGDIDNKVGSKLGIVNIAPLDEESNFIEKFGWLEGKKATDEDTVIAIINDLKERGLLLHVEDYPHVYPHCWRSGDELVFRLVDEWYINMDWRDKIKKIVDDINWIPEWGQDREHEWLDNMGDWMISKKRFWGLALPIWTFEDGSYFVIGSKEELKELACEGWEEFEGKSPHRPWIDKVKIKHPESGLIGTRIKDVGNPWLDAGIVPYSTLDYTNNREYWNDWFPAEFVVESFPGQFRNWFYSLLAMSATMEGKAPFKNLLGHALVKADDGRDMHKSWGNAIWFEDAAEKMGVDVMRWLYSSQNPERNLLFGYSIADEVRKKIITLWNTYSFFVTYANLDGYDPSKADNYNEKDLSKLDKWLLSKINKFTIRADSLYKEFKVYVLMDEASLFLDELSNWYVRRNRRRFWKSENDNDKSAAYYTLHSTLIKYLKVMSPIIPFISDYMYQNLNCKDKSIHLTDYPLSSQESIDESLIEEIDTLLEVVSIGRSSRNKANIKIRQPLSEVVIYSSETKYQKHLLNNKNDILEELNVKNIRFVNDPQEISVTSIKPDFQALRGKFKDNMKDVLSKVNQLNIDELSSIVNDRAVAYDLGDDITVDYLDFIVEETAKEGFEVSSNNVFKVAINTVIDKDLKLEGMIRDLIRHVQNFRKESGLEVSDRINISITPNQDLEEAIKKYKKYFMNEVLGVNICLDGKALDYSKDIEILNHKFVLGLSKENME